MKVKESLNSSKSQTGNSDSDYIILVISFSALILTFWVANLSFDLSLKIVIFAGILAVYGILFRKFYQRPEISEDLPEETVSSGDAEIHFDEDIENKLLALEEASRYFGASLKASDMFRLVSSRINEMIPFSSAILLLADENQTYLKAIFASGKNADVLTNLEIISSSGLAGKVFVGGRAQMGKTLFIDNAAFPPNVLNGLKSAIAAPLFKGSNIFGVLQLFGDETITFGESSLKLLDAVSERFAPLVLSSLAFEKNLSNALTDTLTNLPNERAFFLVLENQIAESQRNRDERPVTVLAIDIKNFAEINQKYGHSTGDNLLYFASEVIKNQLRRMDFLARSVSDEFLTVLPTASEEITQEIIERLNNIFESSPYDVAPDEKIIIQLNYGTATFWKDGETPQELLKNAHIRKQQNKVSDNAKVIKFPKK